MLPVGQVTGVRTWLEWPDWCQIARHVAEPSLRGFSGHADARGHLGHVLDKPLSLIHRLSFATTRTAHKYGEDVRVVNHPAGAEEYVPAYECGQRGVATPDIKRIGDLASLAIPQEVVYKVH
jgi:hypothetical protein